MKFEEMRRYEFDLLELCGRIHGACTGSGDGIPTDVAYEIADWLEWRLDEGWHTLSHPWRWDRYDEAVRELCRIALAELREHMREPLPGRGADDE